MNRSTIRQTAALLGLATAALYFVIATPAVTVVDGNDEPNVVFLIAGMLFLIGAAVVMRWDRRLYMGLFAGFDAFVLLAYFQVAPDRTPSFEVWGMTLRVPQVILLVLLVYLVVRPAVQVSENREWASRSHSMRR